MEYLRPLNENEKNVLLNSFSDVKDQLMECRGNEVYWLNLYLNGKHVVDFPNSNNLWKWVKDLVANVYTDRHAILSYGFIVNPAHSQVDQKFHYDYTTTSSNLFIPLTTVTTLNATQFLTTPLKRSVADDLNNFGDLDKIMQTEQVDALIVSQLICKPLSLVKLNPNVAHRGIANHDNYDRILFFITVDEYYYELQEKVIFKEILSTQYFEQGQYKEQDNSVIV